LKAFERAGQLLFIRPLQRTH
jgi:hypothetical protein